MGGCGLFCVQIKGGISISEYVKFYSTYDYGCHLKHADELKLLAGIGDHDIQQHDEEYTIIMRHLAEQTDLAERVEKSKQAETSIYEKLKTELNEWYEQAAYTRLLMDAKDVRDALNTAEATNAVNLLNIWTDVENGNGGEEIRNNTYKMWAQVREQKKYYPKPGVAWYASYHFDTNSPIANGHQYGMNNKVIASIDDKPFDNKEAAYRYIEGRKKAFGRYFQMPAPPIKRGYEQLFKINGILLDGYTVEE